ncbi:Gfo/Idh/MocA family oxidoreductase [Spongiibacter nanhainus]|uniref:Gfo/Idh/MocA family oxidoreductase n=1 Tax=Spongiibacter nanhainus TaxID=2794344 RepID=A0A7T4URA9_9GAMM|nr:Gfo/Idh/MocA family oxidoreductase [Spongiibacter nanhainus]QQD19536.1 Gfo/Idh/MocA family oxidoreductase [Spongiibacter nanhainus]
MRVIIIGTGFGQYAMAPAFQALGWEVDIVSPRDQAGLNTALATTCDLVSIHAPPFMHKDLVAKALEHNCNVLCDKPFGCNTADAESMVAMVNQSSALHFLNFEFRYDPLWQQLKKLLDDGAIGEPLHLSSSMHLSRGRQVPHGWLFERQLGGGWIGAYASHFVDQLHWLFGYIDDVYSQPRIDFPLRKDRDGNPTQASAEDAISALFTLSNGTTALLDSSFAAAVDQPGQVLLMGSEGSIAIRQGESLNLTKADGSQHNTPFPAGVNTLQASLQAWLQEVEKSIKAKRQIAPNFEDGLRCARVLETMRAAL